MPLSVELTRKEDLRCLKLLSLALLFALLVLGPSVLFKVQILSVASSSTTHGVSSSSSPVPPQNYVGGRLLGEPYSSTPVRLASTGGSPLLYHGGPIEHVQTAYVIFWLPSGMNYTGSEGGATNSYYESIVDRYFNDISKSPFYSMLVQYPDDVNASPESSVVFGGSIIDSDAYPASGNTSNPLTGSDISSEIQKVITSDSLPTGSNYAYYVFTAFGINSCETGLGGLCSFSQTQEQAAPYCAYHSYFDLDSRPVPYANILDAPAGSSSTCIAPSPYPNGDEYADSAVNLVSQEQFDLVTDPLQTAWYDGNNLEISAKCAGDYGVINSTGANVILNQHLYIVQEEWSNAASTCALTPPPTVAVTLTLTPFSGSNPVTSANYFPITYVIGSQFFVIQYSGTPLLIDADQNTSVSVAGTSSASNSLEEWCLSSTCLTYVIGLGKNPQTVSLTYYDLLAQTVYEVSSDSSQPSAYASISYTTAPSTVTSSASDIIATLSSSKQTIWTTRGSSATIASQTAQSSATQQWVTSAATYLITQPEQIPLTLSYHQFAINFTYSVGNGAASTAPQVTFYSLGKEETVAVSAVQEWVDAGTLYNYSSILGASSSSQNERWATQSTNQIGTVTSAATIRVVYYNQYLLNLNYETGGGALGSSPPILSGESFGAPFSVNMNLNSTTYWLDSGSSFSYSNPLSGSTATQRWFSTQNFGGTVNQSLTETILYQHQFAVNFVYSISGGGTPPSEPTILYYSTNGTNSALLTNKAQLLWINAGSNYTVSAAASAKNSTERWAFNSQTSIANSSGTIQITLYHQFEDTFNVTVISGGSTPPQMPVLNATIFGQNTNVPVSNGTQVIWIDAGSSFNFTNPLFPSGSSERWITSEPSGVVTTNSSIRITYYHQVVISAEYSVVNGGSPGGGPTLTVVYLGAPLVINVNQSAGQVWADSPSTYSLASTLAGSSAAERWFANSTLSAPVVSGLSLNVPYYHQYYVTIAANPSSVGQLSSLTGWYDPGSSILTRAFSPNGWQFEGWTGQGLGAYTGSSPLLSLTISSPLTETATFYTALVIEGSMSGSVSYSFSNVTGTVGQGQTKTVYVPADQQLSITANPVPVLFAFSDWKGNFTGGPNATVVKLNPVTFSASGPTSVSVAFKINIFGLVVIAIIVVIGGVSALMFLRRNRPSTEKIEVDEDDLYSSQEGSSSNSTASKGA